MNKTVVKSSVALSAAVLSGALFLGTAGVTPAHAQQKQADPEIQVLPVQGNIYMLAGAGGNVVASFGRDGVFLVDSGNERSAPMLLKKVLETQKELTALPMPNQCRGLHCSSSPFGWTSPGLNGIISSPPPPKPIRYIVNTSVDPDHTGGNPILSKLPAGTKIVGVTFPPVAVAPSAIMISHENVLTRMSEPPTGQKPAPVEAWPTETFHNSMYKLSEFFNGEGVQMFYAPNAHTDGDIFVWFRYSDVIAAGDLLNTESYPVIDVDKGGSINGILDGLNHILDIAIPEFRSQGGTIILPGHGRICDIGDVANYRNMVAIIRDRIQDAISKGKTLEQVKAAKLTFDYDGLYGSTTGPWTTDKFVEAAYKSLSQKH